MKRRHEHLSKSNDQLRRDYEEKKKKFEKERSDFAHITKKLEEAQLSAKGPSTSSLPRSPKPGLVIITLPISLINYYNTKQIAILFHSHKNDKTDGKEKKKKKLW